MNAIDTVARGLAVRAIAAEARTAPALSDAGDGYTAPAILTPLSSFFDQFEDFAKHGGAGDGSAEDEAIERILHACARSGKTAYFPGCTAGIGFAERVALLNGVSMQGQSVVPGLDLGTRFVALSGDAQFLIRAEAGDFMRSGPYANIAIDGNGVGGDRVGGLVWIDLCDEIGFHRLVVRNSKRDNLTITRAQNLEFWGLFLEGAGATSLRIDRGAGGLRFWGGDNNAPASHHIVVTESPDGTWDDGTFVDPGQGSQGYTSPTQLIFRSQVIERGLADAPVDGVVQIYACGGVTFDDCIFAADAVAGITGSGPALEIGGAGSPGAVVNLKGRTSIFPDAAGPSIQLNVNAQLRNYGDIHFFGGSAGIEITDVTAQGRPGSLIAHGGLADDDLITGAYKNSLWTEVENALIGFIPSDGTYHAGFRTRGSAFDRVAITAAGIDFGPGDAPTDAYLHRLGPNGLFTGGYFQANDGVFFDASGTRIFSRADPADGSAFSAPGGVCISTTTGFTWKKNPGSGAGTSGWYLSDVGVLAVAGLPVPRANFVGARGFVTDSTVAAAGNFGTVVSGGGGEVVPVFCDGANWRIGG